MLTGKQFDNYLCIDDLGVLYRQLDELAQHQQVYILCTCDFYIVDYNPAFIMEDEKVCTKKYTKNAP